MEYSNDIDEGYKLLKLRKMSRKLAFKPTKTRLIRKLPQSIFIVPKPEAPVILKVRKKVNTYKRLTYVVLLGVVMAAYLVDTDADQMVNTVNSVSSLTKESLQFWGLS